MNSEIIVFGGDFDNCSRLSHFYKNHTRAHFRPRLERRKFEEFEKVGKSRETFFSQSSRKGNDPSCCFVVYFEKGDEVFDDSTGKVKPQNHFEGGHLAFEYNIFLS